MKEVVLDIHVAHAVAKILRGHWTGIARDDTVRHALSEIVTAAASEHTSADVALRRSIISKLESALTGENMLVDVDAHDGDVALRGIVSDAHKREEILHLASEVDGVVAIQDHIIEVDLRSGSFLLSPQDSATDAR
jgi:osmotically-inducible protein OsmY